MNQNIFGVVLFSLIVGTAIFIGEYTTALPTDKISSPRDIPASKTNCFTKKYAPKAKLEENVKLVQASLNNETNKLTTNFEVVTYKNKNEFVNVRLNFFVKKGEKTNIIASEQLLFKPEIDSNGKATQFILSSFNWLDRLEEKDNLYVVIRSSEHVGFVDPNELNFDESKAIPVLIANE